MTSIYRHFLKKHDNNPFASVLQTKFNKKWEQTSYLDLNKKF